MYRIDIHLKQDAQPDANLRHLSYDAMSIDVKDSAVYIMLPNEQIKAFNMDRVSNFRVHKLRGYGLYEQDGKYYKLFAMKIQGTKYYFVGNIKSGGFIWVSRKYKDAVEMFERAEKFAESHRTFGNKEVLK